MYGSKILLTALGAGALLGTIGGAAFTPRLKPPPEQPWRQSLAPKESPVATYDIVEAPPQDLAPMGWTYGAARVFPQDPVLSDGYSERGARRAIAYRYDDAPLEGADSWNYAAVVEDEAVRASEADPASAPVPAVEAAEAATDAARDAQDQGFGQVAAVPVEQPAI